MRKIALLITALLYQSLSFGQDEKHIDIVNKAYDNYEKRIRELEAQINSQSLERSKRLNSVNILLKNPDSDTKKLQDALQKYYFTENKLKTLQRRYKSLSDSVSKLRRENATLNAKLSYMTERNRQLDSLHVADSIYQITLIETLEKQGRQQINEPAKMNALLDDQSGKNETTITPAKKEWFILGSAGYKLFHAGESVHLSFGRLVNKDQNIFIGFGVGYDRWADDNLQAIPIYLSTRVSVPGPFIKGDKTKTVASFMDYGPAVGFLILDIGYSFYLNQTSENILMGGIFANLGGGVGFNAGETVSIVPQVSWRMQSFRSLDKAQINENYKMLHSADFKLAAYIYLRR